MNQTTALNKEEMEMVASLCGHAGFQLLLEKIQSQIDSLEILMELEEDAKKNGPRFRYWQFLRRIHRTLKSTPENLDAELRAEIPGYDFDAAENRPGDPRVTLGLKYGQMLKPLQTKE